MTLSAAQQIGQQLRDARLGRGLSLHDVADRLKLSLRQLEWMEDGDFARLPGATFVRGFVRNYARFLELDSAPLLALLEQEYPSQAREAAAPVVAAPPAATPHRGRWLGLILLLPLLAALVWWQQAPSAPDTTGHEGELAPMLHQASAAAASAPSVAVPASAPAVASVPAAAAPVASAPVAAGGQKTLRLQMAGDSWVSVVDARGKKLAYGLLRAGSRQEVQGVPPFRLTIGNAQQVTLSYEGVPVALQDKIRGATAKLELN